MELQVNGMHCDACVRRLQKALERLPGASQVAVSLGQARLEGISREAAEEAVRKAGYEVVAAR